MRELLYIVGFALVWALFFGRLTLLNLVVGFLLGVLVLSAIQRGAQGTFPKRLLAVLRYGVRFVVELLVANLAIARLALTPGARLHPHVVAVPLRVRSEAAITLLSATITLLPGTVAMGVSSDKSVLYAHAIGEADVERVRAGVVRIESLILGFLE